MTHHFHSLVLAGAAAAVLAGCDVEPGSVTDYDIVAHADLARLEKAPWLTDVFGGNFDLQLDGGHKADLCTKLLRQADTLTVGAGNERVELYVEGPLDHDDTEACFDDLEAHFAKNAKSKDKGAKPEKVRTEILGDRLFAVAVGPDPLPAPSKARLKDLLDADPSQSGNEPFWFTVHQGAKINDVKYAEGWANANKGLDAHVHVEFKDEATASKLHAEATVALTAMKFSDEMKGIASAVKLAAAGDTITADIKATEKVMRKVVTSADGGGADSKGATARIKIETK